MRKPRALAIAGIAVAAIAGPVFLAGPATASDTEQVAKYTIDAKVAKSGLIDVRETIRYDFGDQSKHGIYRYIPDKARHDKHHDRSYPTTVYDSTMDGRSVEQKVSQKGASKVLQIGDPHRTIIGVHVYVLHYTIDRALNKVDGGPQLFWNAIGAGWDVPMSSITVNVTSPGAISKVKCYAGATGSRTPCNGSKATGDSATYKETNLAAHQGLTVVAALPSAVTAQSPLLVKRTDFAYRMASDPWVWYAAAGVFLVGLIGTGSLVFARGRDRRFSSQIPGLRPARGQSEAEEFRPVLASAEGPVEFVAPKGVRPGSIGVLLDQNTDVRDVTATIVDLAVRGYLRIEEPTAGEWTLTSLRPADANLGEYEQTLLAGLFNGRSEVTLSELRNTFSRTTSTVRSEIYDDAVTQEWYSRRPDLTRLHWRGRGTGLVVVGVLVAVIAAFGFDAGMIGVGVALAGVAMWLAARWMPARTAIGSAAYAQALGFRRYIRVAEASQLKVEEREGVFSRYLPYAIAFNEADRWVKTFAAVNAVNPDAMSGWYVGYGPFVPLYFASSLNSFTVNTGSSLVSTPSSSGSSGFGGGGFSGGGFGGGGGGSW
jgi:uncharacterized membrane protein YgcG